MKDTLDDNFLSSRNILKLIDEYTLYVYYTDIKDLQVRTSYFSPIRGEGRPSFSIFESKFDKQEFMWKDSGKDLKGDIFDLIVHLFGFKSREQAYAKVNQDFDLGYGSSHKVENKIKLYDRPKFKKSSKIAIKSRDFNQEELAFWKRLHITETQFNKYSVKVPSHIWYNILDAGDQIPEIPCELCFAYQIGKYYQIYKPNNLNHKFKNDFPEDFIFGYIQLPPTGEILIIDKSFKDLMFCDVLGYDAVSPRSETTIIPDKIMLDLISRFKRIYITLDNDSAGIAATEKYIKKYPSLIPIFLTEAKDKSDLCLLKGFEYTKEVINKLII